METKTLALAQWKIAGEGAGTLEGVASPYGAVDSYGDTILPGAYDATLADFLKDGFLAVDHNWAERIGFPLEAASTPAGLYTRFAFHSDAEAQKHRVRTAERMAHGKGVGLSIGYQAEKTSQRDDGVRVLEQIRLYEVSIVGVPAEPLAQATGVKAGDAELKPFPSEHSCRLADLGSFDRFRRVNADRHHDGKPIDVIYAHPKSGGGWQQQALRFPTSSWDAGAARAYCASHDGTFEAASGKADDPEALIAGLTAAAVELKEGRQLSSTSRARIRAWLEALAGLDAARADLEDWLEATEPPPKTAHPASGGSLTRQRFVTSRLLARLQLEGLRA